MLRVSVFGLGYVGCVTGACLARAGHEVIGVDVNPEKVAMLQGGRSPVVEPGLGDLVAQVVRAGRLRATASVEEAVAFSDLALVCVGTPGLHNGAPDAGALEGLSREIGRALRRRAAPFTVVVRSTVLPGTTETVVIPALLAGGGLSFHSTLRVVVNPEFMREGSSLQDFAHPPLTVVGSHDPAAASLLRPLYAEVEAPFVHTSVRTAEMVKYVANAFHALKVCFANEVGDVCAALGADAQEVMRVFAQDQKLSISEAYLRPGFAFGGSCLPKDVRALLHAARGCDLLPPLLSAILPANEAQLRRGVEAVLAAGKRRVGVVGLAFKPGTDDLRESPMVALVEALIGKGCEVRILDRGVAVARLLGANRRYIEEQIPHIASLMCASVEALVAHAELLVIGSADPEAERVLAAARPHHVVVDLTRGAVRRATRPEAAA
jgi:GDP-mannose 6-dehydrogenase